MLLARRMERWRASRSKGCSSVATSDGELCATVCDAGASILCIQEKERPMTQPALTADEMIAWLDKTSTNWRALIEEHPERLGMPCDVMGVSTVGGVLKHIVAVELDR